MSYRGAEEINPKGVFSEEEPRLVPPGTPLWRETGDTSERPLPYFYMETQQHGHCRFIKDGNSGWVLQGRHDGPRRYDSLEEALADNPPAEVPGLHNSA